MEFYSGKNFRDSNVEGRATSLPGSAAQRLLRSDLTAFGVDPRESHVRVPRQGPDQDLYFVPGVDGTLQAIRASLAMVMSAAER